MHFEIVLLQSRRRESNPRLALYERATLPTELLRHKDILLQKVVGLEVNIYFFLEDTFSHGPQTYLWERFSCKKDIH